MPLRRFFPWMTVRQEWYLLLCAFSFFLLIGVSIAFTYYAVGVSQHHWCDALTILTQHPVPKPASPAANPSREEGYALYREFLKLKGDFGCA